MQGGVRECLAIASGQGHDNQVGGERDDLAGNVEDRSLGEKGPGTARGEEVEAG